MKFLVDRCAGHKLAEWLRAQNYDTLESKEKGDDPGDQTLLKWAFEETRILITIDTDFGELIFAHSSPHCGLIRLPDIPALKRIEVVEKILQNYSKELNEGAVITVKKGGIIRVSKTPSSEQSKNKNLHNKPKKEETNENLE